MSNTIFHKILSGELPSARIYEDDYIYVFMDAFPQSEGHALIIAKEGSENLLSMDDDLLSRIITFSKKLANAQMQVFHPDGIKVIQLNGAAAGQTIFYYHMHLVPVWKHLVLDPHAEKMVDLAILQEQAAALAKAL